jgi:hypothetical protein
MPTERERNEQFSSGPAPFSDEFGTSTTSVGERHVEVIHGVHAHSFPLASMTVRTARAELSERLNLDPTATATVDGFQVDEDFVLSEGQVLNFLKRAGEKGAADRIA